jgi:hypothetical protein
MHPSIPAISETVVTPSLSVAPITIIPKPLPQYGCLKNGALPTYRTFMNKTQKNYSPVYQVGGATQQRPEVTKPNVSSQYEQQKTEIMEKKINESMSRVQEIKQTTDAKTKTTTVIVDVLQNNHWSDNVCGIDNVMYGVKK